MIYYLHFLQVTRYTRHVSVHVAGVMNLYFFLVALLWKLGPSLSQTQVTHVSSSHFRPPGKLSLSTVSLCEGAEGM